jgi:hypothetical protein
MEKISKDKNIQNMTDELFVQMHKEDGNTAKTINRLPDDPSYVYDIFIPREYNIFPFPERWPKSKKTRIMVGAMDSPFYDNWKKEGELINFDTFWAFETARELITTEFDNTDREFKYLSCIMINRAKYHRRLLLSELDNFGILEKSVFSLLQECKDTDEVVWHNEDHPHYIPSQSWIKDNYRYDSPYFEWNVPRELKQSLIQIVPETIDQGGPTFMTEKTWIPLLLGIPFVVCSTKGFHKDMHEKFGFEPYEEILDYSFDSESNMRLRIHELAKAVYKLKNGNYKKLYNKIKHKVKKNQKLAHQLILEKHSVPTIKSYQDYEWKNTVNKGIERIKKNPFG